MALGVPTGLKVVAGAPHPFLMKQKSFDIVVDQLDDFFTLHLKRNGIPDIVASAGVPEIDSVGWRLQRERGASVDHSRRATHTDPGRPSRWFCFSLVTGEGTQSVAR